MTHSGHAKINCLTIYGLFLLHGLGKNAGRVARALELLDARFIKNKETALVVFDALDRVSHELTEVSRITAGLLRVMLNLRFAKGLRLKAFIREDVLAQAGASVVDGSKLLNSKVTFAMVSGRFIRTCLLQNSPTFLQHLETISRVWSVVPGALSTIAINQMQPKNQKSRKFYGARL